MCRPFESYNSVSFETRQSTMLILSCPFQCGENVSHTFLQSLLDDGGCATLNIHAECFVTCNNALPILLKQLA